MTRNSKSSAREGCRSFPCQTRSKMMHNRHKKSKSVQSSMLVSAFLPPKHLRAFPSLVLQFAPRPPDNPLHLSCSTPHSVLARSRLQRKRPRSCHEESLECLLVILVGVDPNLDPSGMLVEELSDLLVRYANMFRSWLGSTDACIPALFRRGWQEIHLPA